MELCKSSHATPTLYHRLLSVSIHVSIYLVIGVSTYLHLHIYLSIYLSVCFPNQNLASGCAPQLLEYMATAFITLCTFLFRWYMIIAGINDFGGCFS